jgi:hypothetical protein
MPVGREGRDLQERLQGSSCGDNKKKSNLENGMNAAPDTDKQTNLIHKYILYISVQNHGPISADGHLLKKGENKLG